MVSTSTAARAWRGGQPRTGETETMTETEPATPEQPSSDAGGRFRLGPWDAEGAAELTATGPDAEAVLLAGLEGVIAAARAGAPPPSPAAATAAAPIRGQGATLAPLFAELAADLLAQLDANGLGLDRVALDGLLQTDDGGATAWGYLQGAAAADPPPVGLALDGDPVLEQTAGGWALACRLRRA